MGATLRAYKRILCFTTEAILTLDPDDFSVTNTWAWAAVTSCAPGEDPDEMVFAFADTSKLHLKCGFRAVVLTEAARLRTNQQAPAPMPAQRITRTHQLEQVYVQARPHAFVELSSDGETVLAEYPYLNITAASTAADEVQVLYLFIRGKPRRWSSPQAGALLKQIHTASTGLGLSLPALPPALATATHG